MKFTVITALAIAAVVEAAPAAEAEANPQWWCSLPGQSCWKAKREAAPAPAPAAEAEANPQWWCSLPGQSCWKNKRDAAPVAAPEADPQWWCSLPGQSCWKSKRDAEPEAQWWCSLPGQSCWKVKRAADALIESIQSSGGLAVRDDAASQDAFIAKRQVDSLAMSVAVATRDPKAYYGAVGLGAHFPTEAPTTTEKRDAEAEAEADPQWWCSLPGQSCWKRDANPAADPQWWCSLPGQSCWKRSANPEPEAEPQWWCSLPGQSCWKAKRAAEAVIDAITSGEPQARSMPFDPETRVSKREADAEASCNSLDGACTFANRDLHAILNVAREILDTHTA